MSPLSSKDRYDSFEISTSEPTPTSDNLINFHLSMPAEYHSNTCNLHEGWIVQCMDIMDSSVGNARDGKLLEQYDVLFYNKQIKNDLIAARKKAGIKQSPFASKVANDRLPDTIFDLLSPNSDIPQDIKHMITSMQALDSAHIAATRPNAGTGLEEVRVKLGEWTKILRQEVPGEVVSPNFTDMPESTAGRYALYGFVQGKLKEAVAELKDGNRPSLADELERAFPDYLGTLNPQIRGLAEDGVRPDSWDEDRPNEYLRRNHALNVQGRQVTLPHSIGLALEDEVLNYRLLPLVQHRLQEIEIIKTHLWPHVFAL
ncbi:hypothetical protein LTR27_006644 [Elasticomyces elasticus]|nr:hypothetical protein LTR27_006644 [Elasticomyces elasticus]